MDENVQKCSKIRELDQVFNRKCRKIGVLCQKSELGTCYLQNARLHYYSH